MPTDEQRGGVITHKQVGSDYIQLNKEEGLASISKSSCYWRALFRS